jgi:alkylresorcinol/alkylpyrone synthase
MQSLPRLAAMATAVPRYRLDQEAVIERVKRLFAGAPELARVLPVFANSGIRRRYSPAPLEWFDRPHGWADRNRLYLDASVELLETAAGRALAQAGL